MRSDVSIVLANKDARLRSDNELSQRVVFAAFAGSYELQLC